MIWAAVIVLGVACVALFLDARSKREALRAAQKALAALGAQVNAHDGQIGRLARVVATLDPQGVKPTVTLPRPSDEALAAARAARSGELVSPHRSAAAIEAQIEEIAAGPQPPRETAGDRPGFPPVALEDRDALAATLAELRDAPALPDGERPPPIAYAPSADDVLRALDQWQLQRGKAEELDRLLVDLRAIIDGTPEGAQKAQILALARHFEGRALAARRAEDAAEVARRIAAARGDDLAARNEEEAGHADRPSEEETRVYTAPPRQPAVLASSVESPTLPSAGLTVPRTETPGEGASSVAFFRASTPTPLPPPEPRIGDRIVRRYQEFIAAALADGKDARHCFGPSCLRDGTASIICGCRCPSCALLASHLQNAMREIERGAS